MQEGALYWTIPNAITLIRIAAIPVVVGLLYGQTQPSHHLWAAIIFGVALATDMLDGYLARKLKKITALGRILDPVADKLMVISALLMLTHHHFVEPWLAIALIAREVIVNALRSLASAEGMTIHSNMVGKSKVFLEGFGIAFCMFGPGNAIYGFHLFELGRICLWIGLALAFISGAMYFADYFRNQTRSQKGLTAESD